MENIIDELMWRGLIQQSTDIDEMRAMIGDVLAFEVRSAPGARRRNRHERTFDF